MRSLKLLLPVVLLILLIVSTTKGQSIVYDSFYSEATGDTRWMQIYLPPDYEGGTDHYPVIYFLHGWGGVHTSYYMLFNYYEQLLNEGSIEPLIIVKPNGSVGYPYYGSWYTNSELFGNFEDYIVDELVTHIDSTYRTIQTPKKRGIMGHSMGGYGAMKLGLYHPDIYCGWASNSGVVDPHWDSLYVSVLEETHPDSNFSPYNGDASALMFSMAGAFSPDTTNPPYYVNLPIDREGNLVDSVFTRWIPHWPACIDSLLDPLVWNQAIYFDCGTIDELYLYDANLAFADTLDNRGIEYQFEPYLGGHYNFQRLMLSLTFLDSVMNVGPPKHKEAVKW